MRRFQPLAHAIVFLLALGAGSRTLALDVGAAAVPGLVAPPSSEATEGSVAAHWSSRYDAVPGNYRWALARGAFDVGLHLDARPLATRPLDSGADSALPLAATVPSVSVGLRTVSTKGDVSASSLLERALGAGAGEGYERKVGIEWKPAPSRLFLRQGLGIRLDGDDRLTMRLRKGSLGIYVQSNF